MKWYEEKLKKALKLIKEAKTVAEDVRNESLTGIDEVFDDKEWNNIVMLHEELVKACDSFDKPIKRLEKLL